MNKMKKMNKFLLSSVVLCFIVLSYSQSFSQSRNDLDKRYALYKNNKVKTETIEYSDGSRTVTQYDKKGRPTEEKSYNGTVESYITTYKYDKKGRLSEEVYFGYETGDGVNAKFYYDDSGNVIKSISTGSMQDTSEYINDEQGNAITIKNSTADMSAWTGLLNYKNTYDGGRLITIETLCSTGDDFTMYTKNTYDGENLITAEEFDKSCKTGELKFSSKKTFEYSDDNLVKQTTSQSAFTDGIRTGVYSYKKY